MKNIIIILKKIAIVEIVVVAENSIYKFCLLYECVFVAIDIIGVY